MTSPSAPATRSAGEGQGEGIDLTVPLPELSVRTPSPLSELQRSLSGRVVGPEATNLGELDRLFRVGWPAAIALPFGVFADHVGTGPEAPLARLAEPVPASVRG